MFYWDIAIFTTGRNTVDIYLSKNIWLDVFVTENSILLSNIGCKNASVGCIGSDFLYDCIIDRGFYTLTNIHLDVFLPVVKMPCIQ